MYTFYNTLTLRDGWRENAPRCLRLSRPNNPFFTDQPKTIGWTRLAERSVVCAVIRHNTYGRTLQRTKRETAGLGQRRTTAALTHYCRKPRMKSRLSRTILQYRRQFNVISLFVLAGEKYNFT